MRKFGLSFLGLVLTFTLLKGIFWALLVPLWHFPDEQAHFGHVAYLVEGNNPNLGRENDLTEEIAISEKRLGTFRDEKGNNQFTFHPEYRIEYSGNYNGVYEEEIENLSLETRNNFVAKESAYYPHTFYRASGLIYKLFYQSNLFVRVFSIRLFWVWLQLLMIGMVWGIAKIVFPQKPVLVYVATAVTALHPMLTFVGSGVSSDNLHNLLFTAVIYFSLKTIDNPKGGSLIWLILVIGLGLVIKQQFLIAFSVAAPAVIYALIVKPKLITRMLIAGVGAIGTIMILDPVYLPSLIKVVLKGKLPYIGIGREVVIVRPEYGFFEHVVWTVRHTISEVLPWYWGVFNWLGVVLPRWVNRVFMRLLLVAGLGILIKVVNIVKSRKMSREDWYLVFLAWAAAAYYIVLMIWDYFHVRSSGFPFGIQGRYYFPVISAHMVLLTLGFTTAVEAVGRYFKQDWVRPAAWMLIIWFVVVQIVALYTVASAYYDLSSFNTFIIQASQYKPWFAKGGWLIGSLVLYLGSLTALIYRFKHEK